MKKQCFLVAMGFFLNHTAYANMSELNVNDPMAIGKPVWDKGLQTPWDLEAILKDSVHSSDHLPKSYRKLIDFMLPSPNQEDAGSCLYMALTGIAEYWLHRTQPDSQVKSEGPFDLSERYIMNIAGIEESETPLENWRTDSIYLFNHSGHSVANRDYRYTKGWYTGTPSSGLQTAAAHFPEAKYGTTYNWIDERPALEELSLVDLPKFEREIIFADPEQNQWNIGVAPDDIAEKVKQKLVENEAPILVIYNQNSYWHAVVIVGYDDTVDNGNCSYVESFRKVILARAERLQTSANEAATPEDRAYFSIRAKRAFEAAEKIETVYANGGGCRSKKGAFLIRDSIYGGITEGLYDFDPDMYGEERTYSRKIVLKSYDWLRYFGNHIVQIKPAI